MSIASIEDLDRVEVGSSVHVSNGSGGAAGSKMWTRTSEGWVADGCSPIDSSFFRGAVTAGAVSAHDPDLLTPRSYYSSSGNPGVVYYVEATSTTDEPGVGFVLTESSVGLFWLGNGNNSRSAVLGRNTQVMEPSAVPDWATGHMSSVLHIADHILAGRRAQLALQKAQEFNVTRAGQRLHTLAENYPESIPTNEFDRILDRIGLTRERDIPVTVTLHGTRSVPAADVPGLPEGATGEVRMNFSVPVVIEGRGTGCRCGSITSRDIRRLTPEGMSLSDYRVTCTAH